MSSQRRYTREEVSKSNTKDTLLVIIHDKVYDLESFRNDHPGGEEILKDHRGLDATEDFNDIGHSNDAYELMPKYQVGELVESEKANPPRKTWDIGTAKTADANGSGTNWTLIVGAIAVLFLAILYFYN